MTVSAGEIWLADRGDESRRLVFIVSDARFHRLAERAIVAPVLDQMPPSPRPWHIALSDRAIAVNQLGSISIDRLLKRTARAEFETLREVRLVVRQITG